MTIISLTNVTKEFDLGDGITVAPVRNVSLNVAPGEFIMIIGRSGSGKSTLLNLTAGLIKPTSGEVRIEGVDLRAMSDRQISSLRSQKMGFIFQFPSLLPSLTILDNVAMPTVFADRNGRHDARQRAADLLSSVGLAERKEVYPRHLSAGEQKRAAIARSLINHPRMLLADEPTSDLDEQTEKEIMALIRQILDTGVTMLMVTHSLHLIPHATRAMKMENGALVPVGPGQPALTR